MRARSGRPARGERADYAHADIDRVDGDDACEIPEKLAGATRALFEEFGDRGGGRSYGEGMWTVKEVLGHPPAGEPQGQSTRESRSACPGR